MAAFDPAAVVAALKREQLIPDILSEAIAESIAVPLAVSFPSFGTQAALGNDLHEKDTQERPTAAFSAVEGKKYTLVMLDPDAPFRFQPDFRAFRHWVITGLKGDKDVAAQEADVTPWRTPGPREASGTHRYTFLLFEEPEGGFNVPPGAPEWSNELEQRRSWNVAKFAESYRLKLVGANFFLVHKPVQ
ncbi:PEBP-like protein [Auricularia subglabra TFB-10046 SS5]|nr:PEBP-like protein [Auricularia subglabra TFB-10046 SS5]